MEKFDDKNQNTTNQRQDINENKSEKYKNNYRDNRKYENKSYNNRYNTPDNNRTKNFDRNIDRNDNYRSANYNRYSWTRNKILRQEEPRKRTVHYSPLKSKKKNDYYSYNNCNLNRGYQRDKNDLRLNRSRSQHKSFSNSTKNNKYQTNLSTIKEKNINKSHQSNNKHNFDKNEIDKFDINNLKKPNIDDKNTDKLDLNKEENCKNLNIDDKNPNKLEINKRKNFKKPNTPGKRKQNIYKIIENNRKKNDENIIKNSKELLLKNSINYSNNLENINKNYDILQNDDNLNHIINTDTIITPKISLVPLSQLLREELASHFDEITKDISLTNNDTNIINNNKNDKNFESLTDKLLNKVVKMDKINIKNIINNPSAKFDAALKFRASQRFREEIRKQLRALQLENPELNKCNDFESDNFVNDSNIPQLILDQIQQSLGIEFLQEIANETTITGTTLTENNNSMASTILNSSINNNDRSSTVIENIILPFEEIPQIIEESQVINPTITDVQNIDLSKPDLLKKLKNLDTKKISQKRNTSPQKHINTNPLKDISKTLPKVTTKSSPKSSNNNNNNRKKSSIKNNEILTISSTSSSSSSSSSSDSDDDSTSSCSSSNSSINSTYNKKNNRYHHRKDKEIQVVDRFKKLILPTLSVYLRKKYNDKYSKNLTNSLSFIYDICLNKLMKNSNLGSYEKKVLKKNLKSSNNDGALEYLLKNIEELHEQNIKYKKKINNNNNGEKSTNINKKSNIDLQIPKKDLNKQNHITKMNLITKKQNNLTNIEQIDNSVIEAAVQNSEFIASQLKKIAQQKIDERNKEKFNIQQKNLQKLTSSSTVTTSTTLNLNNTSNPNGISSTKANNEQTKQLTPTNDNDEIHTNRKNLTQNCDKNDEISQDKKQVIVDKAIIAKSAGNQQSITKELIQDDLGKSNKLSASSDNDKTINNNNDNPMIEINPIGKMNSVQGIDSNVGNKNKNLSDNMIISNVLLENNIDDNHNTSEDDEKNEYNENFENPDRYDDNNSNSDPNNIQRSWKSPGEKKYVITTSNDNRKISEKISVQEKDSSQETESTSPNRSLEFDNLQMTALIQQNKISDAVLNNLKELDLRLLELHKRKMYVEEMILKLQKDNMAIDLARMQLQNERFLIINSAIAKGNISITTDQLLSSIQRQSENVFIKSEPSSPDWHQSYVNGISVGDYVSSIFPSCNSISSSNNLQSANINTNKRKTINNLPSKIPFSTPFSQKLRNRKKRSQNDILLEDTENILRNSPQDNYNFEVELTTTPDISSEPNNIPVKKSIRIKNNPKIQNKITESLQLLQQRKKKMKLSTETSNSQSATINSDIINNTIISSEIDIQTSTIDNDCYDNNYYKDLDENIDTSLVENGSFDGFKLALTQIRTIGDYIIVSSEDGNIYKYCWYTRELIAKFTKHTEAVIQFFIDSNGFIYSISLDGYLKKTSCENFGLEMQSVNLQEPLQSIDIQWNFAFIGSRWGNIFVYNIKDNKLSETLLYSVGSSIMALKATKEGARKILIVASKGNEINIIDSISGLLLRIINVPVNYNIYSILLCGNIIYCGSNKNEILSFNFMNGQKIGTMICGNGAISMKMFKNKQMFVGCYDGFVYVLDKNNGNQIGRFPGSGNMITALDIIGEKILTAAKDNSLKLADIPNYVLALAK